MGQTDNTRLLRLDGLRGLAATGVMLHHIFLFLAPWQFTGFPVAQAAEWIHHFGWTLVDLFFVLSGFVFAHVYLRDDSLRTQEGMASFWVARIARLWPLHLTMLAVIALFAPHADGNTPLAFVAHLFMLQAFVMPVAGTFDWSSWSLTVEVFCYAIFCMANAHGRKVLLWVTGLMIVVCVLAVIIVSQPGGPYAGSVFRRGLLGFFVGQAMWHARGHLVNLPVPLLVLGMIEGFWFQVGPYSSAFTMTMLAWPCFLLLTLKLKAMEARPMVWLGDRSYAIYLINLPLVQAVVGITSGASFTTGQIVLLQAGVVATVLLAADFSYRWIEMPARTGIRRAWALHRENANKGAWVR